MLQGNQMEKALVGAGYEAPKPKRKRPGKQFKCRKCGAPMIQPEETNVMACSSCANSYFIFDNHR